jgi:hypothetical protein
MCQSCVDIDRQINKYRKQLGSVTDQEEIEHIERLIHQLYADRVRMHQNPEK